MDKLVFQVFQAKFFTGSADVPLFVPVTLQYSIDGCGEYVAANVEFPFVVEEGIFEIFLDD
jgi:hypothetical protein